MRKNKWPTFTHAISVPLGIVQKVANVCFKRLCQLKWHFFKWKYERKSNINIFLEDGRKNLFLHLCLTYFQYSCGCSNFCSTRGVNFEKIMGFFLSILLYLSSVFLMANTHVSKSTWKCYLGEFTLLKNPKPTFIIIIKPSYS